jgi:hypothetical protein
MVCPVVKQKGSLEFSHFFTPSLPRRERLVGNSRHIFLDTLRCFLF